MILLLKKCIKIIYFLQVRFNNQGKKKFYFFISFSFLYINMAHSSYKIVVLIALSLIAFTCNIYCYPYLTKTTSTLITTTAISTSSQPTVTVIIDKRDDKNKEKEEAEKAKDLEEAYKEKAKEEEDKIKEHKNNNGSSQKSTDYSKHEDSGRDSNDDDKKDDSDKENKKDEDKDSSKNDPSKTSKAPATNTVVTTIVVIATESPTTIYSNTDSNPSKQKGDTSSNNQIDDPNSSSSTGSSASETPNSGSLRASEGRSNYRKLVLALSIVGSVAGVVIAAGIFVLTRHIRRRKQKAQYMKDEESGDNNNNSTNFSSISPSHQITPPPNARLYPLPNNDTTLVAHQNNENPFSDPANPAYLNFDSSPSAPLPAALAGDLDLRSYTEYRQNRTLSMFSQTTAAVAPSAPTVKELAVMNYENPFEEEYGTHENITMDQNSHQHDSLLAGHPVLETTSNIHSPQTSRSILQQHHNFHPFNFPPPPAYTPNAIPTVAPTAPPLYALPSTETSYEQASSRRHSISSCSDIQLTRPLSVRRGSGTITYITS